MTPFVSRCLWFSLLYGLITSHYAVYEQSYYIPINQDDLYTVKHSDQRQVKDFTTEEYNHRGNGKYREKKFEERRKGDLVDAEGLKANEENSGSASLNQKQSGHTKEYSLENYGNKNNGQKKGKERYRDKLSKGFHDTYELNEHKTKKKYWKKGDAAGKFLRIGSKHGKKYKTVSGLNNGAFSNNGINEAESTKGGEYTHAVEETWNEQGTPLSNSFFNIKSPTGPTSEALRIK